MPYSWSFPLILERCLSVTYIHTASEEDSLPLLSFNEINRMIATIPERFEHVFGCSSFPMDFNENAYDLMNDEDKLILLMI